MTNERNLLVLTNFRFIADLEHLEEDDLGTRENAQKFVKIMAKFPGKCLCSKLSFNQLTAAEAPTDHYSALKDDSGVISELVRSQISPALDNICFMDMRAE